MAIDVTVLRAFTDRDGKFGNPLGVVDASTVDPSDHQRIATQLGYSETIFIDVPEPGASTADARIYTPATELPFAGHPTVGASWWLRDRGTPVNTLQVPAGIVQVTYEDDLSEGPEQSVRRVLSHLDLSAPAGWEAPKHMSRQADERSERWVAQYRDRTPTQLA